MAPPPATTTFDFEGNPPVDRIFPQIISQGHLIIDPMARKKATTWTFPTAVVVSVHDADTVTLDVVHEVDIGFNDTSTTKRRRNFRLYLGGKFGLNAQELDKPGGPEAAAHLAARLPVGRVLRLESVKNDKYARYDAILFDGDVNVCQELVDQQWAAPWDGKGERPVPPWPRTIA